MKDKPFAIELRAIDPMTGKTKWSVPAAGWQDRFGTLATGSGLMFHGTVTGQLFARDSDTGKALWHVDTGTSIMAAPMTYRVNGVQYVAVQAGWGGGGWGFTPGNSAAYQRGNANRILVFKVGGGTVTVPPPLPAIEPAPVPPPQPAGVTPAMIAQGQMLFTAVVMLRCDWQLFLVVLAMAPVLWIINRHFRVKLSYYSRAASESFSRVTATLAESVNGIRVTQGFVRQETNAGLFRGLLADHARYSIAYARTSAILTPLLELNSQFFVAILLLFGGWRVFEGSMTIDALVTFFLLSNFFFSPIAIIGNQYNQALVAMAGAERVFRLIDMVPDWEDAPDAAPLLDPRRTEIRNVGGVPSPRGTSSWAGGGTRPTEDGTAGMRVEFRDLGFAYEPGRTVLREINFTAEPGQTIALVGHTGSGKSSIINLVAKFYLPTSGELFLDGREVRTITSHSLHRQMGMVQQQNFLFSGTVFDNIRVARPEATEPEIREAAGRLDCLDILEGLPQGFLTEVGEHGSALSVGQRQLVCFTRALLADPRLVILDEATSSIDALTEARLQTALLTLLRGRTSFIVAHRLSTIRHADLVLVLDQGAIVERGTHAKLLAAGGRYAALYRQFVQVDERS